MKSLVISCVKNGWVVTPSESNVTVPMEEMRVFTSCESPYGSEDLLHYLREYYRGLKLAQELAAEKLDAESRQVPYETEP